MEKAMRADYKVGYPIQSLVVPHNAPKAEWKFGLVLEDGTIIRFYEDQPIPNESDVAGNGKFIMAVTNYADASVDIVIGKPNEVDPRNAPSEVMKLHGGVGKYSIINPDDPEIEWYPTMQQREVDVPAEPKERLQRGPAKPEPKGAPKRRRASTKSKRGKSA
jgi:hypothetical protein